MERVLLKLHLTGAVLHTACPQAGMSHGMGPSCTFPSAKVPRQTLHGAGNATSSQQIFWVFKDWMGMLEVGAHWEVTWAGKEKPFLLVQKEMERKLLAAEGRMDHVHATRQEADSMVTALALPFISRALSSKRTGMDPEHRGHSWRCLTQVLPRSHQKHAMGQQGQI